MKLNTNHLQMLSNAVTVLFLLDFLIWDVTSWNVSSCIYSSAFSSFLTSSAGSLIGMNSRAAYFFLPLRWETGLAPYLSKNIVYPLRSSYVRLEKLLTCSKWGFCQPFPPFFRYPNSSLVIWLLRSVKAAIASVLDQGLSEIWVNCVEAVIEIFPVW